MFLKMQQTPSIINAPKQFVPQHKLIKPTSKVLMTS